VRGLHLVTSEVRELSYIHARDITYATFCQGPYDGSARYRDFMGWDTLVFGASSLETLLVGRRVGTMQLIGPYQV
jgi:Bacterial protein of unknown function (DUF899)